MSPALAQNDRQEDDPVFRADVSLVRLLVTVKDDNGRPVGGLTQSDFEVLDSGVAQEVAAFERYTSQPLSIALLIDTSGSTRKELTYEVAAATGFLRAITRDGNPGDALSVYTFNDDVTLQVGFTRNPDRIEDALAELRATSGTSLYDAFTLAAEPLSQRDGRHVVIVITDGGDTTSYTSYQDALRSLHAADAILYPIVVQPITNDPGRNIGGENALITMSTSTGGRWFFPTDARSLEDAFAGILQDLRTQYLLGYYPRDLPPSPNAFRRVSVRLARPDLHASTRAGYYER